MIEIAYTKKRLEKCITFKDIIDDKSLLDTKNREAAAIRAMDGIKSGTLFNKNLRSISIRGKQAYGTTTIEQELVARLTARNIKENYKIRPQNRNLIVRNLTSILRESSPYNIHRFDIESFFESIDRKELFKRLMNENKCSRQTLTLIHQLFKQLELQHIPGLPRGLGISAILSEYALHNFDSEIKKERNIFFYARFVDDIVLITSPELQKKEATQLLEGHIFPGLKLHKAGGKVAHHSIKKVAEGGDVKLEEPKVFEYLGYSFSVHNHNCGETAVLGLPTRRLDIDICDEKIRKIKLRVINSFTNYLSSPKTLVDFSLLEKRVRCLTGNYIVCDPITKISIKTGIYYNYSEKNNKLNCPLVRLDAFLRGLLFSGNYKLSSRIQRSLTLPQRKQLVGYTFSGGFHKSRLHSFNYEDLKIIKGVWKK